MHRARRITDAVKSYDRLLFCKEEKLGDIYVLSVFRNCKEWRREGFGNLSIVNCFDNPYRVMCLTDNWGIRGNPVDWGVLPILARLQAMDLWQSGVTVDDLKEDYDKFEASKDRAMRNNIESFLYDFKSAFAKSTNDVNTSGLSKYDSRKLKEKSIWQ